MKKLNDLEYLKLNKFQALLYKIGLFFCSIPTFFKKLGLSIINFFKNIGLGIAGEAKDIVMTFAKGNWAVKLSFLIFGFGNFFYGQPLRGVLFLIFEIVFFVYMFVPSGGIYWLMKGNWFRIGSTIGTLQGKFEYDMIYDTDVWVPGDDSVKVLLYGLLTIIFIVAFIYTWRMQVKQCRICMDITARGKKVKSGKQDLKSLLDDQFHKTMLALPLGGIIIFTVIPIIFMILIAFTSYDAQHDGYSNLFSWVGLDNFNELLNFGYGGMGLAFGEILAWTLMWAFFATFSNYFLGMIVAMLINKKGIKIKKFWRTVLVMTIAIPQFVSLLYVSKLFDSSGILMGFARNAGSFLQNELAYVATQFGQTYEQAMGAFSFLNIPSNWTPWGQPGTARALLIIVNVWVGIPYIMLMATGILMNIPQDLYESARIDGASPWQQYMKITLPYMLFVTGPYLLTSFVGNLNNFNVIYLLTNGNPINTEIGTAGGVSVGWTDLLITWLYRMTASNPQSKYNMASVIGILVFVVVAILSLIVYNIIPSTKNEEDFK